MLLIGLFVISCKKDEIIDSNNLVGTWVKEEVVSDDGKQHVHASLGGPFQLKLNQDGKATDYGYSFYKTLIQMNWNFNKTNNILTLSLKDTLNYPEIINKATIYKIYELTEDKMVCKPIFNNIHMYNGVDDI